MNEHPILFSTSMVQATQEGRKTMTRRVIKGVPDWADYDGVGWDAFSRAYGKEYVAARGTYNGERAEKMIRCPYGQVGDHLWVRETWNMALV